MQASSSLSLSLITHSHTYTQLRCKAQPLFILSTVKFVKLGFSLQTAIRILLGFNKCWFPQLPSPTLHKTTSCHSGK